MKNFFLLILTGVPFFFCLYMIFGPVKVERFCDAQAGVLVEIPDLVGSLDKVLRGENVQTLLNYGLGGENAGRLLEGAREIQISPFKMELLRFLTPHFTLIFPGDLFEYSRDRFPILTLVDVGRFGLIFNAMGVAGRAGKAQSRREYLGHSLVSSGRLTMTQVRNIVIVGEEDAVKTALDAYEKNIPSIAEKPDVHRAGRALLKGDADVSGIFLSADILTPAARAKADPRFLVSGKNFSAGAFQFRIEDDGLRGQAIIQSRPGKTLIKALDTAHGPYALASHIKTAPLYVAGLRSSNLSEAAGALAERIFPELRLGGGLKKKVMIFIFRQLLTQIGPEILFAIEGESQIHVIAQVKDPTKMAMIMEGVAKKLGPEPPPMAEILRSEKLLRGVLREGRLTVDELLTHIEELPKESQQVARKWLAKHLPQGQEALSPAYPSFDIQGKQLRYTIRESTLFLSTDPAALDSFLSSSHDGLGPLASIFPPAGPSGSAFFAADLAPVLRAALPAAAGAADFERIFAEPLKLAVQLFDETQGLRFEASLDFDMGSALPEEAMASVYRFLFQAIGVVLLLAGLSCGYFFLRRCVRLAGKSRG